MKEPELWKAMQDYAAARNTSLSLRLEKSIWTCKEDNVWDLDGVSNTPEQAFKNMKTKVLGELFNQKARYTIALTEIAQAISEVPG